MGFWGFGDSLPETVPVYSVGGMMVHGDPLQALAPERYRSLIEMGGQVTAKPVGGGRESTFSTQGLRGFGPSSSQDHLASCQNWWGSYLSESLSCWGAN